jgi:hypothetical protein
LAGIGTPASASFERTNVVLNTFLAVFLMVYGEDGAGGNVMGGVGVENIALFACTGLGEGAARGSESSDKGAHDGVGDDGG